MRSKSPLALMEQVVMLLVFGLAAALCLQAFAFADQMSARNRAVDRAVVECQRAAETLKAFGLSEPDLNRCIRKTEQVLRGQTRQGVTWVDYDKDWNVVAQGEPGVAYTLSMQGVPAPGEGLWMYHICVMDSQGTQPLFALDVVWPQEVSGHG